MSGSLLIRGGRVIDPAAQRDGEFDVLIRDGRIAAVVEPGTAVGDDSAQTVDASGCWVLPGLIDVHVHLREPGYEYKETIETGARAAVCGGFTSVACMANTNPVNDSAAVTEFIRERAQAAGLARVYPIGAVSKGLLGEEIAEIGEMLEAGIVAISDDGMPITDGSLMRRALEYSAMFGLAVIAHEEDRCIAGEGVMHEGSTSLRLGLRGVPAAAEEAMIARDIALLEQTPGRLHIAHLSTANAVELVRAAKRRGLQVTAEVAPHHFTLTDAAVGGYQTNAKMNPPLRTQRDVDAVRAGLADGTIDVIASDHAPHHADDKEVEFDRAANGIVGLETTLPLALQLSRDAAVPLQRIVAALTINPARLLRLSLGTLEAGAVADVSIVDPEMSWVVEPARLHSRSKNTPFGGMPMRGRARCTIVGGRIVWPEPTEAAGQRAAGPSNRRSSEVRP
jgi:dihydroorotase